jgi:hypothetical protein
MSDHVYVHEELYCMYCGAFGPIEGDTPCVSPHNVNAAKKRVQRLTKERNDALKLAREAVEVMREGERNLVRAFLARPDVKALGGGE